MYQVNKYPNKKNIISYDIKYIICIILLLLLTEAVCVFFLFYDISVRVLTAIIWVTTDPAPSSWSSWKGSTSRLTCPKTTTSSYSTNTSMTLPRAGLPVSGGCFRGSLDDCTESDEKMGVTDFLEYIVWWLSLDQMSANAASLSQKWDFHSYRRSHVELYSSDNKTPALSGHQPDIFSPSWGGF